MKNQINKIISKIDNMNLPNQKSKLEISDLNPDLTDLADVIGLDLLEELILKFGGANYYIPKISSLDNFVDRHIKSNKNKTYKQLARDLNVSENFIKKRMAKK